MSSEQLILHEKPSASYMIAGWKRQWSDGGEISSGLTQYLIDKLGARKIGEMGKTVSSMCYPFQAPGSHDTFRPGVAFKDGLPGKELYRENYFYYDSANALIIFQGEEPWFRIDTYGEAFFTAMRELEVKQAVVVEGYNGPAPPEMERSVSCLYSSPSMREQLDKYGVSFSNYGSRGRSGPTIGMALVSLAHYAYTDLEMFRLGAMAPMYPFMTSNNEQVAIPKDHSSFYYIMRRLNALFKLDIDLTELKTRGEAESSRLQETLERIASSNSDAKQIIDRARADYRFTPYTEPVELPAELDRTLEDILKDMGEDPDSP